METTKLVQGKDVIALGESYYGLIFPIKFL